MPYEVKKRHRERAMIRPNGPVSCRNPLHLKHWIFDMKSKISDTVYKLFDIKAAQAHIVYRIFNTASKIRDCKERKHVT